MNNLTSKEKIIIQHALTLLNNENNKEYNILLENNGFYNISRKIRDFYEKENDFICNLIKKIEEE